MTFSLTTKCFQNLKYDLKQMQTEHVILIKDNTIIEVSSVVH